MTILTNIFAAFGLACLMFITVTLALFIRSWRHFAREDKRTRARAARPRSLSEREAEQIILQFMR